MIQEGIKYLYLNVNPFFFFRNVLINLDITLILSENGWKSVTNLSSGTH